MPTTTRSASTSVPSASSTAPTCVPSPAATISETSVRVRRSTPFSRCSVGEHRGQLRAEDAEQRQRVAHQDADRAPGRARRRGDLEPDPAAADHHHAGAGAQQGAQPVAVVEGPQVDARPARPAPGTSRRRGLRAGREHEVVPARAGPGAVDDVVGAEVDRRRPWSPAAGRRRGPRTSPPGARTRRRARRCPAGSPSTAAAARTGARSRHRAGRPGRRTPARAAPRPSSRPPARHPRPRPDRSRHSPASSAAGRPAHQVAGPGAMGAVWRSPLLDAPHARAGMAADWHSGAMQIWPGRPYPLGATYDGTGTNFALFSEVAERVELCLIDDDGTETRVDLPEVDALRLARVPARRSQPGPALRLPRARPVRPGAGPPLQPERSCCSTRTPRRSTGRSTATRRCTRTSSTTRTSATTTTPRRTR